MTDGVIFERSLGRGRVLRLEIATYKGSTFGNLRIWIQDGDDLKPTAKGVTFPLALLGDLAAAFAAAARANAVSGPQNAS